MVLENADSSSTYQVSTKKKHQRKGEQSAKAAGVPVVVKKKGRIFSRFNALKTGKYAKLPIYCDDCIYRSKDDGGNGKCGSYEAGSVCVIRQDIQKHIGLLDSRKPDHIRQMVDEMIQMLMGRTLFAAWQAGVDGNVIDRHTNAQMNTLMQYMRFATELNKPVKMELTEVHTEGGTDTDMITNLFRQMKVN